MRCKSGRFLAALIISWFVLCLPSPSQAQDEPYKTEIIGVEDEKLEKTLELSSNLIQLAKDRAPSPAGLIHRAWSDEKRLGEVLKSFGYFSGTVQIAIEGQSLQDLRPGDLSEKETPSIEIKIAPGPLYRIQKITVEGLEHPEFANLTPELKLGDPAAGQSVLDAERDLVGRVKLAGYPFVRMEDRKLMVNHSEQSMDVHWKIATGPRSFLGDLSIQGLEQVEEDFILNRAPWKSGDSYDPRTLESFRSDLSNMDLFSSIKIGIPEQSELKGGTESEPLPVSLKLEEKPFRFFGFGADYSTTEGIGLNAFWGHRNFFGRGEKLKITGRLARIGENEFGNIDQRLGLDFQKPDFLSRNQDLLFSGELVNEHPDAFDRKAITGTLGLNRRVSKTLSISGGISGEYSKIRDNESEDEFTLLGFPFALKHDTTDNLLDPKTGFRNEFRVTPYTTVFGPGGGFTKFRLGSRGYYKAKEDGSVVLAGRFLLGSIVGSATANIPANKRFFAGGGGSVRGYEFQNVGPLDNEDKPLGGRSLIEVGAEVRLRYKDFGLVPFVDGGNVFDSELPKFDQDLQWAVGLGVRYYTKIGPLRLDVAVPLNRRDNDDPAAFYISIGQSF